MLLTHIGWGLSTRLTQFTIDRLRYLVAVNVEYVYMIEEISRVGCKKYPIWDFFYIELRRYPIKVFLFKQNKYYLTINVEIGNIY